jgi:3-isopropylmalate/(R)-2-methylmalate dehydratase small subunit
LGKAWLYGDNVDTDVIIPARYLTATDPVALAAHALEDLDPSFAGNVHPGDVVVAGDNFGCGSSREHAPLALMGARVAAVVAKSFARIFFRNAINTGLTVLVSPAAVEATTAGDELEVDAEAGVIRNASTGAVFTAEPLPEFVLAIVRTGGLVEWVRLRQLETEGVA